MIMEEWRWEKLLADIEGRQVIPVIGPELLIVTIDGAPVPLYQHVADQLLERLELDRSNLPPESGFYQVVSEFLAQQPTHVRHYEADMIYYKIREIIGEKEWDIPLPLQQLASITHFDLFVSTTADLMMERALTAARPGAKPVRSLAFCKKEKLEDLPDETAGDPTTTVYHVFGKINAMNDFAVTDEDILHYAHRLQSQDFRPQHLFDQFREKRMLTLGCSFPGWLTRFFLAAAKGEELFTLGVPGLLADTLSSKDRDLVGFLERKRTNVYQGDAAMFVAELQKRWLVRFGSRNEEPAAPSESGPDLREMEPDSVFISFRREDRDTARAIAKKFTEVGIDAWFDETDLNPGDLYQTKIEMNIRNCFAFVPLISKHSVSEDSKPWFYRFEWNKAIEAAEFRGRTFQFILPLLIDETNPQDPRIPTEFQRYQMSRIGQLDTLITTTRSRIRDLRRGGAMA